MNEQNLRMSDAEREQAATELAEHFAQGRLTADEHSERLDQVWAARTRGELAPIFSDLPGPHVGANSPSPPASRTRGRTPRSRRSLPAPLTVVLALLVVFTVVTHLPLILLGLLVWWFLTRHHCAAGPRRW